VGAGSPKSSKQHKKTPIFADFISLDKSVKYDSMAVWGKSMGPPTPIPQNRHRRRLARPGDDARPVELAANREFAMT
jgi:hypothetical protein